MTLKKLSTIHAELVGHVENFQIMIVGVSEGKSVNKDDLQQVLDYFDLVVVDLEDMLRVMGVPVQ